MQIVNLEDEELTKWREERRARIMGSIAKTVIPLSRGTDRTPAGEWQLIGEMLTIMPEEELPMNRGHRLEGDAIDKISAKLKLPFNKDRVIWLSESDKSQGVSPDAAQPGDKPSYAAEVKNLKEGKHFKYLYKQRSFTGNPIDLVPNETGAFYKEQCIQYFVINENLQTLYFGLHCPEAIYEEHELVIITIKREDIKPLIEAQDTLQKQVLTRARSIVTELTKNL